MCVYIWTCMIMYRWGVLQRIIGWGPLLTPARRQRACACRAYIHTNVYIYVYIYIYSSMYRRIVVHIRWGWGPLLTRARRQRACACTAGAVAGRHTYIYICIYLCILYIYIHHYVPAGCRATGVNPVNLPLVLTRKKQIHRNKETKP